METAKTHEEKRADAAELLEAAQNGANVRNADPRATSPEAVILANKIMRAQGAAALNMPQSGL